MRLKQNHSKKSKSFFAIIYETYKDFAENTSIHGLKYTVKDEIGIWEKFFWILVLFLGLLTSVYLTFLFWDRYVSNPTRTTIKSLYAPTTSIPFPAVTICNINRILDSKIDTFMSTIDINESERKYIRKSIPQVLSFTDPTSTSFNETELNALQDVLERNNIFNMSTLLKRITQSCSEMVKFCLWTGRAINCTELFKEIVTADGYCCSFNYRSSDIYYRYTEYNGLGSGITVILDPMLQPVQYSSLKASGFKVIIHDPEEYPGPQATTKLISIGRLSYLQMYGTKMTCSKAVKNLPISQRNCYYPDELQLRNFDGYTDSNCLTECEAYYIYEKCDCVPYYYKFTGKPQCNTSKLSCLLEVRSTDVDTMDLCNCPAQCEDDYYKVISEHSTFDYEESMSMLEFGNTTITKDSVLLSVFFNEQTQAIYMRDTIFSTVYLLSSFGGVYSLFMGCSLITVVEIVYYCLFRFFVNMKLLNTVDVKDENTSKSRRQVNAIYSENIESYGTLYYSTFLP